jgi:hypothetical protein
MSEQQAWLWPPAVVLVFALVFVGARWGGRMVERNYAEGRELAGVLVLGACAIGPLVLMARAGAESVLLRAALVLAFAAGLFADRQPTR